MNKAKKTTQTNVKDQTAFEAALAEICRSISVNFARWLAEKDRFGDRRFDLEGSGIYTFEGLFDEFLQTPYKER